MKLTQLTTFCLFAILTILGYCAFIPAKHTAAPEESLYDTLQFNAVSVSGVKLGSDYGKVLEKFGSPDSVRKQENAIEDQSDFYEEYVYDKDILFVVNETFSGFELKTARFMLDKLDLKVGDNASKVKKLFPKSFKNRDIDEFNPDWVTVSVQFGQSDSFLDIYMEEGKIKSMITTTEDGTEED